MSCEGIMPRTSSQDCVDICTRNVEDIESSMAMIDASSTAKTQQGPLNLAVIRPKQANQASLINEALLDDWAADSSIDLTDVSLDSLQAGFYAGLILISRKTLAAFGYLPIDKMVVDVAKWLGKARQIIREQVKTAWAKKQALINELDGLFAQFDALITPTLPDLPITPIAALNGQQDLSASCYIRPFNLSGHPAISVSIGAYEAPVGVQIVGRQQGD